MQVNVIKLWPFTIFPQLFQFSMSNSQTLISHFFVSQIFSSFSCRVEQKMQVCLRMYDLLLLQGMEELR